MTKYAYQPTPRDEWKSVKIKNTEYPQLFILHSQGISYRTLAQQYNVSLETISRIFNERHKQKQYENANTYNKNMLNDDDFYKKKLLRTKSFMLEHKYTKL